MTHGRNDVITLTTVSYVNNNNRSTKSTQIWILKKKSCGDNSDNSDHCSMFLVPGSCPSSPVMAPSEIQTRV